MRPEPLPPQLQGRPFVRREARAFGVSEPRLRRHGLVHQTRSLWLPRSPTSVVEHARGVLPLLPADAAFSHETAAALLGLPLPPRLARASSLHIVTSTTTAQRRRPDWVGHRGAESRAIVDVRGLPVVGAVDTWFDLAEYAVGRRRAISLADMVMVGDAVLASLAHSLYPDTAAHGLDRREVQDRLVHRIQAVLAARVRPRGKTVLAEAIPMLRLGVRSPQESRARVLFVLSGLPEPEVNVPVYSDDGWTWLAEGDMVWRRRVGSEVRKVVAEYQGEYHAERAQRSRDSQRSERLRDHGWAVHEVWAEDLNEPSRRWHLLVRLARSLEVPVSHLVAQPWL